MNNKNPNKTIDGAKDEEPGVSELHYRRLFEGALPVLILAIFSWLIFGPFTIAEEPLLRNYMIFPLLIWLAFKFTWRGMANALLLCSIIAIWNTWQGYGIFGFANQTRIENLVPLLIFLVVMVFSGFFLNALVSERKRAEEALAFSNTIFSTQQELSIDGMLVVDEKGEILSFNQRFVDMWSIPLDVIESKSDERALQSVMDKLASPKEFIRKVKHLYEVRNEVSRDEVVLKDGRTFDRYTTPMYAAEGKYYGRVWYFHDITNQKQLLKNSENAKMAARNILKDLSIEKSKMEMEIAKDEAIFSSIGDGLIVTDNKGNIIQVNEAFEKLLGWSAKEVTGKKMLDVVQKVDENGEIIPPDKRSLQRVLTGEIAAGKVSSIVKTHSYIRRDKSKFPVIGIVTPIILNNKILGAVQLFRDVTYEREIDKAKTEFVSLASHQLRTPLSAVNWYAEMLLAGNAGKLNKEQKNFINEIYSGNQRMVNLVNALLNVSRIEMGTLAVDPQPTDFGKVADNILKELKKQISDKKLKIKKDYYSDIPKINADPNIIRIIFQNLLTNAVKYTPEKEKISVSLEKDNDNVLIKVSDTGYGIPKDQQGRIFEKMFRADNIKEKDTEGTGLGLYLVKAIIEDSKGKIWFESEENKGTTFYVTLPLSGMKKKEGVKTINEEKI